MPQDARKPNGLCEDMGGNEGEMRNPIDDEWSEISIKRWPVYAVIRTSGKKRLLKGVIVSRPYLVDYVVFKSTGETYDVEKTNILIDEKEYKFYH